MIHHDIFRFFPLHGKQSQGLGVGTESEIVIPPAICRLVFHLATGAYFMFVRTVVDWVPVVPLIILIYPIVYNFNYLKLWDRDHLRCPTIYHRFIT